MKCTHCGTEAYDYQTICLNCGNRLVKEELVIEEKITETRTVKKISPDKKLIALAFAIAFGGLGAHCFYLGEKKKGIRRIVVGLLLFPVASVLTVIDVVKIITDKYTIIE